jgi:hypothetical protein
MALKPLDIGHLNPSETPCCCHPLTLCALTLILPGWGCAPFPRRSNPLSWHDCAQQSTVIAQRGAHSFSLIDPAKTLPELADLVHSPEVLALLRTLAAQVCPRARDASVYSVLRIMTGPHAHTEPALHLHYDATAITMLVPLAIPDGTPEEAGDFVYFEPRRPLRRSVVWNLLEKAWMQNPWTRARYIRAARARDAAARIVRLEPGSAYFFWGYQTYHGNFEIAPNRLRATLLLHLGDPHAGSWLTAAVLAWRKWRVGAA